MLCDVYPNKEWQAWKFQAVPREWWGNTVNIRIFLSYVESQLQIKSQQDWYKVSNGLYDSSLFFFRFSLSSLSISFSLSCCKISNQEFFRLGGYSLCRRCKGVSNVLKLYLPEYDWKDLNFDEVLCVSSVFILLLELSLLLYYLSTLHCYVLNLSAL